MREVEFAKIMKKTLNWELKSFLKSFSPTIKKYIGKKLHIYFMHLVF